MASRPRKRALTVPEHWPASSIEMRPVNSLIPYARNARQHDAAQVDALASSIREFGFTMPILIDEGGEIIAGHGRVMAARKLEMANVPCMMVRGWTDAKRAAYVLADNRLAEQATWDDSLLKLELGTLRDAGFDVSLTGFSPKQVDAMFAPSKAAGAGSEQETRGQFGVLVMCQNRSEEDREVESLSKAGKKVKRLASFGSGRNGDV